MTFGQGAYTYQYDADWGGHDSQYHGGWIPGVACDSHDRVYVYSRSDKPLNVFDKDGQHLASWGEGVLTPRCAHGIFIDGNDHVFVTDATDHAVYKFSSSGELLLTLGTPGQPGTNEGEPFNKPTDIAVASNGDILVSDGYGNHHVHRYNATGEHICTWGGEGAKSGQFSISHTVRLDADDRVWICDRENNRIQIFDLDGKFLDEWKGLLRPNNIYIDSKEDTVYIAELGRRISIFQISTRELLADWGGGGEPSQEPGLFIGGPHGIWVDSSGDIYAGEVELGTEGRMHKYKRQQ
jgi:DNA-binding beta-propeller fold protein YncE